MRGKIAKKLRRIARSAGEELELPPLKYKALERVKHFHNKTGGMTPYKVRQFILDQKCQRAMYKQLKLAWKQSPKRNRSILSAQKVV